MLRRFPPVFERENLNHVLDLFSILLTNNNHISSNYIYTSRRARIFMRGFSCAVCNSRRQRYNVIGFETVTDHGACFYTVFKHGHANNYYQTRTCKSFMNILEAYPFLLRKGMNIYHGGAGWLSFESVH